MSREVVKARALVMLKHVSALYASDPSSVSHASDPSSVSPELAEATVQLWHLRSSLD